MEYAGEGRAADALVPFLPVSKPYAVRSRAKEQRRRYSVTGAVFG
jgi:hypothetical protein